MKRLFTMLATCCFLAACGKEAPVEIGFIGGLTDRNADTGQAGLNGVILALENFNRAGGLNGKPVGLVVRDDSQDAKVAETSARQLVRAGVAGIIGPFTSAMAEVIQPITAQAGIFEISPTLTSMNFHGKDDNLFRINRTTRDNAMDYARIMVDRGERNIAVAYDMRNRNFSVSWLEEFRAALEQMGAKVAVAVPYESRPDTPFGAIVRKMVDAKPDGLFFISGALDVARLSQQARRQAPDLPIGASEWAATEQLVNLGGEVVEGLLISQNYDRNDPSPRFREFSDAYFKRFQQYPGYSSVSAYDAATVLLTALKMRRPGETVKQSALRNNPYQGLQQTIDFDQNGDTVRKVYFTEIRNGQYVPTR